MTLSISLRPVDGAGACALCRVPATDATVTCPTCRSTYHRDCLIELASRCATLGCAGLTRAMVRSMGARQLQLSPETPVALGVSIAVAIAACMVVDEAATGGALAGWLLLGGAAAIGGCVLLAWLLTAPAAARQPALTPVASAGEGPGLVPFAWTLCVASSFGAVVGVAATESTSWFMALAGGGAGLLVGVPLGVLATWLVGACWPPARARRRPPS